jgi:hypothetical protein
MGDAETPEATTVMTPPEAAVCTKNLLRFNFALVILITPFQSGNSKNPDPQSSEPPLY